ncbi:cellulose biosynthesis protein BcsG, partial [Salmonella enterica subsp. enterica serovar Kentucky]|nr:cellulose biosynthesis protein BcsG [Salmonella enterica subsp. enterica serovar Kentucky]
MELSEANSLSAISRAPDWRGLSGWNFYFLVKFGLLWAGYLNFHPLLNLVFMAFLLMPIP